MVSSDGIVEINAGQQKIDFFINSKTTGEELNFSVKNYSLKDSYKSINVLDETPLTTILLDQGVDFTNHFLNIFNLHEFDANSYKGKVTKQKTFKNVNNAYIQTEVKEAVNVLKILSLSSAIAGFQLGGRKIAEWILINDSSKNGADSVKIIGVYELIEQLLENFETSSSFQIDRKGINQLGKSVLPSNSFASNPTARITKLLSEAHERKVRVSIKNSEILAYRP